MVCFASLQPRRGLHLSASHPLVHCICLSPLLVVCEVTPTLRRFWIVISKSSPKDYAKMIRARYLTHPNYKEQSVIGTFNEMIPTAAMLGGIVIGFLTVLGDLFDVAGSSTGIMLSISILYGYYEKIRPTEKVITDF